MKPSLPMDKMDELIAENQDLRARLAEAEETLRAIRSGEVDALVVSGADGEQVFTLQGADYPYRMLIEEMSEGALTLTLEGAIFYANRRFAEMLKTPLEQVIGARFDRWIAPADRATFQASLRRNNPQTRYRQEVTLLAGDGTVIPCYLSLNILQIEEVLDCFCLVATDLTEQKRNEAIMAAEKLARSILEQAAEAIVVCDHTTRIIRAGEVAHTLCGENPLGQPFERVFPLQQTDGAAFSLAEFGQRRQIEARLDRRGAVLDLLVSVGPLVGPQGEKLGSVIALTDITQRKRTEETLRASLAEKTALLKEVHHRVKNNLQVISSLLGLQADRTLIPEAAAVLQDMQDRIHSMGLLHETLYRSNDFARINLSEYVESLCVQLWRAVGSVTDRIELERRLDPVSLSLDQAIPCGLIVNELISNALKHAFPVGQNGRVRVMVESRTEREILLVVADDGVGLPPDLDPRHTDTLGLQLVFVLTRQLRGTLALAREAGTAFQIVFPIKDD